MLTDHGQSRNPVILRFGNVVFYSEDANMPWANLETSQS